MIRALVLLSLLFSTPAKAETLTILTDSIGTSHYMKARMLSKYFIKYLPNTTSVNIKEVSGAGGVVLANYIYNVAPRDGWTISTVSKKIPLLGVIGGKNINYNPSEMTWIGSVADGRKDAGLMLSNKKDPDSIGFDSISSANEVMRFIQPVYPNIKVITGYKTSEIYLTLQRKEVDSIVAAMIGVKTASPQLLSNSNILVQFGNGTKRHEKLKDVPTLSELIKDEKLLRLLSASELSYIILRGYYAPPNIPKNQETALREAFVKSVLDPEYIEEANKANIDVNLITHTEIESIIKKMMELPREILEELR